ncbi:hypothetical protein Vi05172_g12707 [Venturia inaequalis]|nr:hypothetical protein Vi05172_g12707 [Venturia inaequalis]
MKEPTFDHHPAECEPHPPKRIDTDRSIKVAPIQKDAAAVSTFPAHPPPSRYSLATKKAKKCHVTYEANIVYARRRWNLQMRPPITTRRLIGYCRGEKDVHT